MDVDFELNEHTTQVPVHLAQVQIGVQAQKLWISLQDQSLSIVSDQCVDCQTSNKHQNTTSARVGNNGSVPCEGGNKTILYQDGFDPDNMAFSQANRSGYIVEDVFKFTYEGKTDNQSVKLAEQWMCEMK